MMFYHKIIPPKEVMDLLIHDEHGVEQLDKYPSLQEREFVFRKLINAGRMDIFVYSSDILFCLTRQTKWIVRLDTVTKPNTSPYSLIKGYSKLAEFLPNLPYVKMETRTKNKKLIEVMERKIKGFTMEGIHMNCDDVGTTEYSGGWRIK